MEKSQLDTMIFESVAKTIENMAFTEILPTDLKMTEADDEYAVFIPVLEPCTGCFTMTISRNLLCFIAESMLAIPGEEISEANLLDFLSEVLNTISGSFLSAALPGDTPFSLGLPKTVPTNVISAPVPTMPWNFIAEQTIFSVVVSGDIVEHLINISNN